MSDKILLVEDEPLLRKVLAGGLRRKGFDVIEAFDGDDAVEIIDSGERYDVLVTDAQITAKAGRPGLIRHALRANPQIAVVLMSDGTIKKTSPPSLGRQGAFLPKPFILSQLTTLIMGLLYFCRLDLTGELAQASVDQSLTTPLEPSYRLPASQL